LVPQNQLKYVHDVNSHVEHIDAGVSDHSCLVVEIEANAVARVPRHSTKRPQMIDRHRLIRDKTLQREYAIELHKELSLLNITPESSAADDVKMYTETVRKTAHRIIGKKPTRSRKENYFCSDESKAILGPFAEDRTRCNRNRMAAPNDPKLDKLYRRSVEKCRRAARQREKAWQQELADELEKNIAENKKKEQFEDMIANNLTRTVKNQELKSLLDKDGIEVTDKQKMANIFADFYEDLFNKNPLRLHLTHITVALNSCDGYT
jgi:hypothetical protein